MAQGGPLSAIFTAYAIDNNKLTNTMEIKNYKYKQHHKFIVGPVWFGKKYLEEFGFNYEYLDNIVDKLVSGKVKLNTMITNDYHPKFTKK